MNISIETHGCKLNMADSQIMVRKFSKKGFTLVSNEEHPDVYILNSCTVTVSADRKARRALRSARDRYPDCLIVAAGCYPERDAVAVDQLKEVDLVVPNNLKSKIVDIVSAHLGKEISPSPMEDKITGKSMLLGRTRASVKIQEGCDQVCAYCIVPKVRGRERSITADAIIKNINELYEIGCSEVVLTGTQLGTYGLDIGDTTLSKLLKLIIDQTDMPRIRVSSLQPLEISDAVLDLWCDSQGRLCPHFHIPLQSGSDRVLKLMRRRYTRTEFTNSVGRVRSAVPNCSITTDIIVGFPTETSLDHSKTMELVDDIGFADVHIFPYSERPGTSAVYLDGKVDPELKKERIQSLKKKTSSDALKFRLAHVGNVASVLWEGRRGQSGLTENYLRVRMGTLNSNTELFNSGSQSSDVFGDGLIELIRLERVTNDGFMIGTPI